MHALVTGGSSGIGLECARQLLGEGASVTIVARNQARLDEALIDLGGSDRARAEAADVGDFGEVEAAVARAREAFGEVGALICCAGMAECKTFEDTTPEDLDRLMRVNFLGTAHAAKAVVPGMKDAGAGKIVLVSSQAGQVGIFGYTAYSPSKFALTGFAQALQMEVRPHGIAVSVCYPPDTDTPQYAHENRTKPAVTKAISGGGKPFSAERVASLILAGMRRGKFTIHVGLEGLALAVATCGFSPANSPWALLLEMLLLPLLRAVTQILLFDWNRLARREAPRKKDN